MYSVAISDIVEEKMDRFTARVLRAVWSRIIELQDDPRPAGSRPLGDAVPNGYSLLVPEVNYRILYVVNDEDKRVDVFDIYRL